jgi:Carboxypeptidase regulatory-like domain
MIAALLVALMAAQAPAGDGAITGRVVDAVSGKPIAAALVSIRGSGLTANPLPNQPPQILTDVDGRFVFQRLGPGSYSIRATKGGYSEGASGRRRPDGESQTIQIGAAPAAEDTIVRMWKQGAIGGTVTDEAGEPMVGMPVRLLLRNKPGSTPGGSGGFVAIARPYSSVGNPAQTDDRGIYRFSGLAAGDYLVVAVLPPVSGTRSVLDDAAKLGRGGSDLTSLAVEGAMREFRTVDVRAPLRIGDAVVSTSGLTLLPPTAGGPLRIYPTTFYLGAATVTQAAPITLAAGEERGGIDIQLTPVPVARVSGTVLGSEGPAPLARMRLAPAGSEALPNDLQAPTSVTDGAGNFVFAAVPAGQYTLRGALPGLQGSISVPLTVAGLDVDGLVATARPAIRVTATLQFDGTTSPPKGPDGGGPLSMPAFILDAADPVNAPDQLQATIIGNDRGYVVTGYAAGRYRVRVPASPSGWMFKAAMLNGVDVSETPFDFTRDVTDLTLVFSDRWTGLSGAVQGRGADAATVLAFPTDASKWTGDGFAPRRFKSAATNARGEFAMSSLPPGDYYVVAVPDEQAEGWRDPSVLDTLARAAATVTILDGEHRTVTLPMREARQ